MRARARAPLQQELGDIPGSPSAEIPVAVAPLPVQGQAGVTRHLGRVDVARRPSISKPPLEPNQDQVAGGGELVLVVGAELQAPPQLTAAQERITSLVRARIDALAGDTLGELADWQTTLRAMANHIEDLEARAKRRVDAELSAAIDMASVAPPEPGAPAKSGENTHEEDR